MEIGRAVRQRARGAGQGGHGDLLHPGIGTFFADAGALVIGELATLVHHAADGLWETRMIDAVQDHLGDGLLALHAFAAGLEIQRLGQALQIGRVDLDGRLAGGASLLGFICNLVLPVGHGRNCCDRRKSDSHTHGNARQP